MTDLITITMQSDSRLKCGRKHRLTLVVFAGIGFLLFSCSNRYNLKSDKLTKSTGNVPKSIAVDSSKESNELENVLETVKASQREYKISPHDLLQITVYGEEDLSRTLRVSQSGLIGFPLIGTVKIGGLTLIEAEDLLAKKLDDGYLINPQVTVFLKEYYAKKVYILGQVKRPGSYEIPVEKGLSVMEAIALAGGFTDIAAGDRTRIIRTSSDKPETITVRASEITKGDKSKDIELQSSDILYVPETLF